MSERVPDEESLLDEATKLVDAELPSSSRAERAEKIAEVAGSLAQMNSDVYSRHVDEPEERQKKAS